MNPQKPVIYASAAQIERWAQIAEEELEKQQRRTMDVLDARHKQDRLKTTSNFIEKRQEAERSKLEQRQEQELQRFQSSVVLARRSGLIPDPAHAPTHTRENIDEWARAYRDGLASAQKHHADEIIRALHEGGEDMTLPGVVDELSVLRDQQEIDKGNMEHEIRQAYETGRIPEPIEQQRSAANERGMAL
jgi:hypothetical protein